MKKVLLVLAMGLVSGLAYANNYAIDMSHTHVGFSVKHMMVSTTKGHFDDYTATIVYDPANVASNKIEATIQAASINTNNVQRDEHLKNADFLDVTQFPTITFVSKSFTDKVIVGDLTIKGVTKEVSIPVEVLGPVNTPFGTTVLGINGEVVINRQDFGVNWNKALDQGGVAVADDVKIILSIEAVKQ